MISPSLPMKSRSSQTEFRGAGVVGGFKVCSTAKLDIYPCKLSERQRSQIDSRMAGPSRSDSPPRRKTKSFCTYPSPPSPPRLKQETHSAYNLKLEALRGFLKRRFPGHPFSEIRVGDCSPFPPSFSCILWLLDAYIQLKISYD